MLRSTTGGVYRRVRALPGSIPVAQGAIKTLTIADSTPIDPVSGIGASGSGWVAIVKLKGLTSLVGTVDATKLTINVTDPGYDTSGNATTVSRAIAGVAHLRRQYPNGASKMISTDGTDLTIYVTLDQQIYSGTTVVSASLASGFYPSSVICTSASNINISAENYPQPLVGWINPQQVSCGSTYAVEATASHQHAMAGQQVACIKFSASDGTLTTPVVTSSTPSISSIITQGYPPEVFKGTLDMSTLSQGTVCNVNAIVYPWLGNNPLDLSVSGIAWPTSLAQTKLRVLCDRTGGYGGAYAYVKVGAGGGTVSATAATALADPYPTLPAALAAIKVWNNANRGHNDYGGSTIRLMDASGSNIIHVISGSDPASSPGLTYCTVEKDPAAVGTVTISWDTQLQYPDMMRWRTLLAHGSPSLTFTSGPIIGATSATLNANWTGITGVYNVTFIETVGGAKENRSVTLTNGATTATWASALTAICNASSANLNYMWLGPAVDRSMVVFDGLTINNDANHNVSGWWSTNYFYNLTFTGANALDFNAVGPSIRNNAIYAGCVGTAAATFYQGLAHLVIGNNLPGLAIGPDGLTGTDGDDGAIIFNNKLWKAIFSNPSAKTFNLGMAVAQNVFEEVGQSVSACFFNDGDLTTISNFIEYHNTAVGDRCNHLYNDVPATKIVPNGMRKSGVFKYNIWDNFNIKGDTFNSGAGSTGNMRAMYQVGNVGNVSLFGAVGRGATDTPHNDNTDVPYMGNAWLSSSEYNLGRTALGLSQAQIMAMFTNYTVAPQASPAVGGNYLPLAGNSNAVAYLYGRVPSGQAVLKYDLAGTARRNDGTGAAGAYELQIVTALLHFDGTQDSTTIIDQKGHIFTVGADAHLDTAQFRYGGASLLLDGAGDYVACASSPDWAISSSQQFSVEGYIRPTSALGSDAVWVASNIASGFQIGMKSATEWGLAENGTAWIVFTTTLPSLDAWNFIQVSRDSSNIIHLGLNGIEVATSAADTRPFAQGALFIGAMNAGAGFFNGWQDEWRLTKGASSPINLPTAPFPNS